jgi:chromosome partitioning protein
MNEVIDETINDILANLGENQLEQISSRGIRAIKIAQKMALSPNKQKLPVEYTTGQVAELIGRSTSLIKQAEKEIGGPKTKRTGTLNRRCYTIADINRLRKHFGRESRLSRAIKITVANFKGGCAKSTTSVNLAHGLAEKGYRVLVVDCDAQASTTEILLSVIPDAEVRDDQTLSPIFGSESQFIGPEQILDTSWDNVKLIPAQMSLLDADHNARTQSQPFNVMSTAIEGIEDDFDYILFDTPPTLSYLSLVPIFMADMIITPVPPRMMDFASTVSFFTMLNEWCKEFEHTIPVVRIFPVMINRAESRHGADDAQPLERRLLEVMRQTFGPWLLSTEILTSAVTSRLAANFQSLYEPDTRDAAWRRAIAGYQLLTDHIVDTSQALLESEAQEDAAEAEMAEVVHG